MTDVGVRYEITKLFGSLTFQIVNEICAVSRKSMYLLATMIWIIVVLVVLCTCSAGDVSSIELSALHDLYNATNGDNWLWSNATDVGIIWDFSEPTPNPCDPVWQGITCTCDDISCAITELLLEAYGLNGTVPMSIGSLSYLEFFSLAINELRGTLPNSITQLTHLIYLDMSENLQMNGPLPTSLESMTNLEFFYMSYNAFTGAIPASLFELPSLRFIELSNNWLGGSLPDTVGSAESVVFFDISFNYFSGPLPASIGNMTGMISLLLNDNSIAGTIPPEICRLTGLGTLYAVDNAFTGPIPECVGEMTGLKLMSFNVNQLNGTVPASIVQLNQTLQELTMSFNQLTGSLPFNLFNSSGTLDTVYFSHNSLTGPLPDIVLPALLNLDLSYNYISGTLANTLINSTDLVYLDISYNALDGPIPPEINQNYFLFQLVVGHNALTGPLPESYEGHEHMAQYMMDFNLFTGTIPYSLCYNDPGYIDLESNLLEGTIPDCAGATDYEYGRLVYFSMSDNVLSGTIPSYVMVENNIITISLNNNALSGTLPYFNSSRTLEYLYVQSNDFSGPIQLSPDYCRLEFVDISNNQFTGSLPKDFFNSLMNVKSFAATSNCLTGKIPKELCSLTNLTFVDLDGLSTAEECRSRIFPGLPSFTSFVLPNQIEGGIPDCLFGMPLLQTLHISGNSIDWSFPSSGLVLSDSLSELSLSHNKITGTIPDIIQQRQWTTLDLSFNKLGGNLNPFVAQYSENASLVLQVNRLSGGVPSSLLDMPSINILTGNLFGCDFERNGLPIHDNAHDTYQCGSNSFNQASIGWLVCVGLSIILLCLVSFYRWDQWMSAWCVSVWDSVQLYLAQFTEVECELTTFRDSLIFLRDVFVLFTLGIVVVFLPVYSALTHYYKTAQYQYAWTVSAAFLAGVPPAIILLLLYSILIVLLFSVWFYHTRHKISLSVDSLTAPSLDEKPVSKVPIAHRLILICVALVNCVVMVLVNTGYVLVVLNDSSQAIFFAQVAIALFKLMWNDFAVRGMIAVAKLVYYKLVARTIDENEENLHFSVDMPYLTFIVLFNSIIAPCLATAAVDSNCFFNTIVAPTAVSLQFPYFNVIGTCNFFIAEYTGETVCGSINEESYVEVTYDPPFIYSYQCTSSMLTNYAAVYVFMFIIVAFFKPLTLYILHRTYTRVPVGSCLHQCIDVTMYELLKPANVKDLPSSDIEKSGDENRKVLFFKDRFVLRMVGKIAVFVTFGVIFPPLAVIVCAAFVSEIYVNFILIGRFLTEVEDESTRNQFRALLSKDCEGCMRLLLNPLVTLVVPFASLFYGFFVFDIYGDKAGFAQAIWAPIFLAMVPAVLWTGYSGYRVIRNRQRDRNNSLKGVRESELVVVNVLQKENNFI